MRTKSNIKTKMKVTPRFKGWKCTLVSMVWHKFLKAIHFLKEGMHNRIYDGTLVNGLWNANVITQVEALQ